jgi:hypothetical protein
MADLGAVGRSADGDEDGYRALTVRAAFPSLTKTISGIISDDTSTPAARIVRVYRRLDGVLIGETTSEAGTGAYSLACIDEEVQRVVLDDAAGTLYNDLIDRVLPGP